MDSSRAVFHVNDYEIVARECDDLGQSGGEGEQEDTIEGFAVPEAGFDRGRGRRRGRVRGASERGEGGEFGGV